MAILTATMRLGTDILAMQKPKRG